jgi:hypothetical protein
MYIYIHIICIYIYIHEHIHVYIHHLTILIGSFRGPIPMSSRFFFGIPWPPLQILRQSGSDHHLRHLPMAIPCDGRLAMAGLGFCPLLGAKNMEISMGFTLQ